MRAEFFSFSPRSTEVFRSAWKSLLEPFLKPAADLYFYVLPHLLNQNPRILVTSAVLVKALSAKSSLVSVLFRLNLRISPRIFWTPGRSVAIRKWGEEGLIIAQFFGSESLGALRASTGNDATKLAIDVPLRKYTAMKTWAKLRSLYFQKTFSQFRISLLYEN